MKKILVTGGAGFIGSNFILYWRKHYPQDFIINFDKLTYAGNLENLQSIQTDKNYKFVKGDICSPLEVQTVMKDIDTVVHFAAESHVDRSIMEPAPFIATNVLGTQVLLDAAVKNGVRHFHHISTDEVFGSLELTDKTIFSEETAYNPHSPYAASKAASDHLVRAYSHTYKLPITITNCSNNYGPYQFPEKLIPLAITNLLEGKKVPVYGDGLYVRDWLSVEDHCNAIDLVIQKGAIGETYCVGGMKEEVSNIAVLRKIIRMVDKEESSIEFAKDRPGHDRRYAINSAKLQKLGWKPHHSLDEWLAITVEWYKKNQAWWQHVKSGQYQDYYRKQYGSV